MKKVIKKIHTCHCERSAAIQSNYIAKFFDWTASFLAVTGILLTLTACDSKETPAPEGKPTIKIGAILPLSGNAAAAGQAAKAALELIIENKNKDNLKYNYVLAFEDDQLQPKKIATSANKLINIDNVNAVFSIWNIAGNIVADFAKPKDIFAFSCSFDKKSTDGKYSYNFNPELSKVADVFVTEVKKRNLNNLAMLTTSAHGEINKALLKAFEENNINLTFFQEGNMGSTDFRIDIAKAQQTTPQAYIILDGPPSPYIFMKQLKEITGRNDNVLTINTFAEISYDARAIVEGMWFVETGFKEPTSFTKQLKEDKNTRANSCTTLIAAALEVFVDAVENAEIAENKTIPTNDSINAWIWGNVKNYNTVAGKTTIIKDGLLHTDPQVKMIKNKEVVDYIEE